MTDTAMRNHFLMDNLEIYVNLKFKSINSVIDKKKGILNLLLSSPSQTYCRHIGTSILVPCLILCLIYESIFNSEEFYS